MLHETLIKLADPADRAAYMETAQANVARWAATTEQWSERSKFEVVEGDWGDVASAMTRGYGRCFAVLNMANAYGEGGHGRRCSFRSPAGASLWKVITFTCCCCLIAMRMRMRARCSLARCRRGLRGGHARAGGEHGSRPADLPFFLIGHSF